MWHDEGLWETADEKAERLEREASDEGQEFQRQQLVSAQQQMTGDSNVRVGPIVDASQLAPSEWPGEVIDRRTRR